MVTHDFPERSRSGWKGTVVEPRQPLPLPPPLLCPRQQGPYIGLSMGGHFAIFEALLSHFFATYKPLTEFKKNH